MKKILLISAAAVALMVGCTEGEPGSRGNAGAVKFSNLNDKVTRAANATNSNYKVYADWSGGTAGWYIDDTVDGTTNLALNGPYYWPIGGSTEFYSWAPATVTATGVFPALSIAYAVPAAADEDFTIATPLTGLTSGTAAFQFAHKLSQITVAIDLTQALKDAGYTIVTTGVTATLGVNSTGGTIDPTAASPVWTAPNATAASYTGALTYMIMPQTSTGCTIAPVGNVVISLNGNQVYNAGLLSYTILAGDITAPTLDQFVMGTHYTLTLTITSASTGPGGPIFGDPILFSSTLSPWVDANQALPLP